MKKIAGTAQDKQGNQEQPSQNKTKNPVMFYPGNDTHYEEFCRYHKVMSVYATH